jgi:hypothetical protein
VDCAAEAGGGVDPGGSLENSRKGVGGRAYILAALQFGGLGCASMVDEVEMGGQH